MKKRLLLSLSFILVCSASAGQSASKFSGSVLWKISGNNLKEPSYVLGTHHLFAKDYIDSIAGLNYAINTTKQVVPELNMLNMDIFMQETQRVAMMPEGVTYRSLLTAEEYTMLDAGLKANMGAGLDQMGSIKPAMLSTLVMFAAYYRSNPHLAGTDFSKEGIDVHIQRIADSARRPIIALETVEEQLYILFDSEPLKSQAKQLVCTVNNMDYLEKENAALQKYYRIGQLDKLYAFFDDDSDNPCAPSEQYVDELVINRNNRWMEKLPAIMGEDSSLIVVGAGHLGGEPGLLFQLDQKGYKVESVTN